MERRCRCGRALAQSSRGDDDLGLCLAHSLKALAYARDDYRSGYTDGHAGAPPVPSSDCYLAGYVDGQVAAGHALPGEAVSSWVHFWRVWSGSEALGARFTTFASLMASLEVEEAIQWASEANPTP